MSRDTSSTAERSAAAELIRSDWIAECERIEREVPASGALDGERTRRLSEANRRMRERVSSLVNGGVMPVPDKETGLGAFA